MNIWSFDPTLGQIFSFFFLIDRLYLRKHRAKNRFNLFKLVWELFEKENFFFTFEIYKTYT